MRGLRLGLTLVIAITTVGCGSASPSGPAATGPGTTTVSGTVVLPAGSTLDRSKLTVAGPYGSGAVAADGKFTVPARASGPTAVDVTDVDGKIVLLGFVDAAKSPAALSPASTATVLLVYALGAFTVPGDSFAAVVDLIAQRPEAASLATTLEGRLAIAPTLITDGDTDAIAAVLDARDTILASTEAAASRPGGPSTRGVDSAGGPAIVATLAVAGRPGGSSEIELAARANVLIDDPGERSGIEVLANPDGPGIIARNSHRRDVALFAYQVASEDATGRRTELPEPVLVGAAHPVPATRTLNVIISTLDAFSSSGRSAWAPVFSDPLDLPLVAGSTRTFYTIIAIGPTADPSDVPTLFTTPKWFDQVDAWKQAARDLGWRGFIGEHIVPVLSLTIFGGIYQVSTARLVEFENALRTNAERVLTKHGVADPVALRARSKALATLITEASADASYNRQLIAEVTQVVGEQELNAERISATQARFGLLSKAGLILAIIDAVFSAADVGAVAKDLLSSSQAESWSATAVEPAVHLEPATGSVSPESPSAEFVVTVNGEPNAIYLYRWSTTGQYGLVSDFLSDGLSVDSRSDKALYLANDPASITEDLEDTVTVEVFEDDGSGTIAAGATAIGRATARVTGLHPQESDPPITEGKGRLVVDSLEVTDGSFNKKKWCVGFWLAIPFTPGATDYFVHATGFVGDDTEPVQDFHIIWTQISDYPVEPIINCPTGIQLNGKEVWIFLGGAESFAGPIEKAEVDKLDARVGGVKADVRTE